MRHAGQIGVGPNFHAGPGTGEKLTGLKEVVQGKLTGNTELAETGQMRRTGELKKRQDEENDRNSDPFAQPDDTPQQSTEETPEE